MASLWSSAWVCPPLATPQPVSAAGDLFVLPPPGRAGVVPAASPATGCCKGQVLQLVAASHVAASAKAEPATNPLLAAATAGGTRLEGSRALGMGRVLVWDVGAFQDETSMTFSHPREGMVLPQGSQWGACPTQGAWRLQTTLRAADPLPASLSLHHAGLQGSEQGQGIFRAAARAGFPGGIPSHSLLLCYR